MALISCPECGGLVSTTAPACPHCGAVPPAEPPPAQPSAQPAAGAPPVRPATSAGAPTAEAKPTEMAAMGIGIALIALVVVASYSAIASRPQASAPRASSAAASPPPPTAGELMARLRETEAAGDPVAVVEAAEAVPRHHPGTPEADTAAAVAARYAEAAEAERQRRAEEAERQRLALKWSYSSYKDGMTGRPSRSASIRSENTVSFDFPYAGPQHGTLVLRDHPTYGRDVLLRIERGQILCRSYEDCTIRVRFDDSAPQSWRAVGPADNSTETVFLRNQARFRQRLASSDVVRVQVPVYQEGEPTFEFQVGGFDPERFQGD